MHRRGFDALTKRMAHATTRRPVLRGFLGGGAAVVVARAGTTLAARQDKVDICHYDADAGVWEWLSVSGNAWYSETGHGGHDMDFLRGTGDGACCNDSECDDGDIWTTNTCDDGTCATESISGCCTADSQCKEVDACTPANCLESTNTCNSTTYCPGGFGNVGVNLACLNGCQCASGKCGSKGFCMPVGDTSLNPKPFCPAT